MKLNYLLFGGGAVVQEYYLPAFAYLNILDQVSIIEPDEHACRQIGAQYKVKTVQATAADFIQQNKLPHNPAAIIAIPNHLHFEVTRLCLQHKIPVLCEKPLSLKKDHCFDIQRLSEQNKTLFSAAMVRRYLPGFKALQNLLKKGQLGTVRSVEISDGGAYSWLADSRSFFEKQNGGVLADMGIHYLDQLYVLFGELTPVSYSDDSRGGVESTCSFVLKTSAGAPVTLRLSRSIKLENRFTIYGDQGVAYCVKDTFDACYLEQDNITQKITLQEPFLRAKNLAPDFSSCFVEQLLHFDESVCYARPPAVSAAEAAHAVSLVEWAYARQKNAVQVLQEPIRYGITGASGFIGTALATFLAEKGHLIKAPLRSYRQCAQIARFNIDMPRYDLLNYSNVEQKLAGCDHIIHLAYASNGQQSEAVNINGTKNVVKAALANNARSLTVLSTMYVYGHPETSHALDETATFSPAGGDYGRTKMHMQRWCLSFAQQNPQLSLSVLNPSCVYGPWGKTYTTLPSDLAKNNRFCWVDNGTGIANVVYIDDVIQAIMLSLHKPVAHGQNFIINGHSLSWKQFLQPLLPDHDFLSLSRKTLTEQSYRPKSTLKNMASHLAGNYTFIDLVNRHPVLGKIKRGLFNTTPALKNTLERNADYQAKSTIKTLNEPPVFNPPVWLADLFGPTLTRFSSAKAESMLGWKSTPFEESMQKTISWLKEYHA